MTVKCHARSLVAFLLIAAANAVCVPRKTAASPSLLPETTRFVLPPQAGPAPVPPPETTSFVLAPNAEPATSSSLSPASSPETTSSGLAPEAGRDTSSSLSPASSPETTPFGLAPEAKPDTSSSSSPASSPLAPEANPDTSSSLAPAPETASSPLAPDAEPCSDETEPAAPPPITNENDAPAPAAASPEESLTMTMAPIDAGSDGGSVAPAGVGASLFARHTGFKIPTISHGGDSGSLKKLCRDTDYPVLCVASLSPFLVSGRADPASGLEVAIKAATKYVEVAVSKASRLAAGADEETATALGYCKDSYSEALDNLREATGAAAHGDVGSANSTLSAVVTASENCEDNFAGGDSPMAKYNETLRKMASNCLAIASLMN